MFVHAIVLFHASSPYQTDEHIVEQPDSKHRFVSCLVSGRTARIPAIFAIMVSGRIGFPRESLQQVQYWPEFRAGFPGAPVSPSSVHAWLASLNSGCTGYSLGLVGLVCRLGFRVHWILMKGGCNQAYLSRDATATIEKQCDVASVVGRWQNNAHNAGTSIEDGLRPAGWRAGAAARAGVGPDAKSKRAFPEIVFLLDLLRRRRIRRETPFSPHAPENSGESLQCDARQLLIGGSVHDCGEQLDTAICVAHNTVVAYSTHITVFHERSTLHLMQCEKALRHLLDKCCENLAGRCCAPVLHSRK
jgi:hypothetical protein